MAPLHGALLIVPRIGQAEDPVAAIMDPTGQDVPAVQTDPADPAAREVPVMAMWVEAVPAEADPIIIYITTTAASLPAI